MCNPYIEGHRYYPRVNSGDYICKAFVIFKKKDPSVCWNCCNCVSIEEHLVCLRYQPGEA